MYPAELVVPQNKFTPDADGLMALNHISIVSWVIPLKNDGAGPAMAVEDPLEDIPVATSDTIPELALLYATMLAAVPTRLLPE